MKKLTYIFIIVSFFGVSCSSKKISTSKQEAFSCLCCSEIYFTDSLYFRSNAFGKSADQLTSIKKAEIKAKEELARQIYDYINSLTKSYTDLSFPKSENGEIIENTLRNTLKEEINNTSIICQKTIENNSKYTTYLAIEIKNRSFIKALNLNIQNDTNINEQDKTSLILILNKSMQ